MVKHMNNIERISYASKILVHTLLKIIEQVIEGLITKDKFAFRRGKRTREAILAVR